MVRRSKLPAQVSAFAWEGPHVFEGVPLPGPHPIWTSPKGLSCKHHLRVELRVSLHHTNFGDTFGPDQAASNSF